MRRARVIAAIALPAAIIVGFLGASAFNPDSGSVLHNEALWRIFGIMFEGGLALLAITIALLIVIAAFRATRSHSRTIHQSHSRP